MLSETVSLTFLYSKTDKWLEIYLCKSDPNGPQMQNVSYCCLIGTGGENYKRTMPPTPLFCFYKDDKLLLRLAIMDSCFSVGCGRKPLPQVKPGRELAMGRGAVVPLWCSPRTCHPWGLEYSVRLSASSCRAAFRGKAYSVLPWLDPGGVGGNSVIPLTVFQSCWHC